MHGKTGTHIKELVALTLLISLLLAGVTNITKSQVNRITANVIVSCPFKARLVPSSLYPKIGNIIINYTIVSTASCNATGLQGYADFYNPSDSANTVRINISTSSAENLAVHPLSFNSFLLKSGTETGYILIKNPATNSTSNYTVTFKIEGSANISINRLSVPSVYKGSPVYFYIDLINNGGYSASNLTAHWKITGPANYSAQIPIGPMAGQGSTENISSEHNNISAMPGNYRLTLYISYNSIGITKRTANYNVSYSILQNSGTAPTIIPLPTTPASKPSVEVQSAPVYILSNNGEPLISDLRIKNTGNSTEQINISIPNSARSFLSISSGNISLSPKGSASVHLAFSPHNISGSKIIPINLTVSSGGLSNRQSEFIMYQVQNSSASRIRITTQVNLLNGTNEAYGIIEITAPNSTPINNSNIETYLPYSLASNTSQINAYGLPNSVNGSNGNFSIRWHIPYLQKGQKIYAYFTVMRPGNIQSVGALANLVFQSAAPQSAVLKIISVSAPLAHPNSTITIKVLALYTGTSAQNIDFEYTASSNTTVLNSSQRVLAAPDNLIHVSFIESIGNQTGTLQNFLQVSTNGSVQGASVPLFVTPAAPPSSVPTTVVEGNTLGQFGFRNTKSIIYIIGTLLIIAVISISVKKIEMRMAARRHVGELASIKERIKRGDNR